jgi:hypothetical protein
MGIALRSFSSYILAADKFGEAKAGFGMRRMTFASAAVILAVVASGIVAGTTVGVGVAGAAEHASKAAFCEANDSIDRAGANVSSNAGFLAVLKKHTHDLTVLKENAPSGALGQTVQGTVTEAETAISSNNANELNNIPDGANIDTYCGVNGNGNPLPAYFSKGTGTAFCSTFLPIYVAVSNAPNAAGRVAALTAHEAGINQLASELSTLPKSLKAKATATLDKAQAAIKTNNPAKINGSGNGSGPAMYVALYCGQNQ